MVKTMENSIKTLECDLINLQTQLDTLIADRAKYCADVMETIMVVVRNNHYYTNLKLESGEQILEIEGDWVRCRFGSFPIAPMICPIPHVEVSKSAFAYDKLTKNSFMTILHDMEGFVPLLKDQLLTLKQIAYQNRINKVKSQLQQLL
jgi:hypothetical protein